MRKRYLLGALALIACLIVGGSVAYFSAQDNGDNAFAMGKVDIEVEEDGWEPDDDHLIAAGAVFDKAPKAKNTGNVDCYVRMNVTLSTYKVMGKILEDADSDFDGLFDGLNTSEWEKAGEPKIDEDKDTITYQYIHKAPLTPGESTKALFERIKFPENMTDDPAILSDIGEKFTVTINADAIQSETYGSAEDAFEAYDEL